MSVAPVRRRFAGRPLAADGGGRLTGPFAAHRLALAAVLALSAVMNTYALAQNGWANGFYSAGVKSMLHSLHNFLYLSFDPGGLVSIDKPPLALWLQVASAKIFGFTPLSVLLPEAIAAVACVGVVYLALARPLGRWAAVAAALALSVFPAFVAIGRDNNPDALLILLMTLACWAALRAIESGRLRTIVLCGLLVGLAFNAKALAAYLVVPGIALGYLLCAPGPLRARAVKLLAGGLVMAVVSVAWLSFVDLTPASERPYVGSSTDNSELSLAFAYNGLGRLDGQEGGPERIPERPGAMVPLSQRPPAGTGPAAAAAQRRMRQAQAQLQAEQGVRMLPDGRARHPSAFGAATGPLRLFEPLLGGQAGWLMPFAVVGLLALALVGVLERRRRDRRLAVLAVFGGWLAVEAIFLSYAKGIVHPYYAAALAPGVAAMVGGAVAGIVALWRRRTAWATALVALAAGLTVLAEAELLLRAHFIRWLIPVLVAVASLCVLVVAVASAIGGEARPPAASAASAEAGAAGIASTPVRAGALAVLLAALLAAPAAYSAATWTAPVQGTFPVAGPHGAAGFGGFDAPPQDIEQYRSLLAYLSRHRAGSRFSVLTVSAVAAAPMILMGSPAASLAGYSGVDPALDGAGLARLVRRGEARYVLLGGPYAGRGGNRATRAVLRACRQLPDSVWDGLSLDKYSFALFDCAGDAAELSRAP